MRPLLQVLRTITSRDLARDLAVPETVAANAIDQVTRCLDSIDPENPSVGAILGAIQSGAAAMAAQGTMGDAVDQCIASLQEPYRTILPAFARRVPVTEIAAKMGMTEAEVKRYVARGYAGIRMRMRGDQPAALMAVTSTSRPTSS